MSICPNINTPEWKALEAGVGKIEAYRDFMETNGEIRTPEEVQAKLAERANPGPTIIESPAPDDMPATMIDAVIDIGQNKVGLMDEAILNDASDNTVHPTSDTHVEAMDLIQQLSDTLGVDFQIVTAAEAQALTEQAKNPWKAGDVSFYVGGTVYFVGNHISMENAFHEFAHPFVRHIANTNPTLFNRLYSNLQMTDEGKAIIAEEKELYANVPELHKEEVLVRALTAVGLDKLNKLKTQSAFAKVVNDLMYAIKQAIRKLFGSKLPVSGLTPATSMNDLADMLLKGNKIQLDRSKISQEDIVAYNKDRTKFTEEMVAVGSNETQALLNKFYDVTSDHIKKLLNNKNYDALADLLTDADKRGDLQELKSNLAQFQTTVGNMSGKVLNDIEDVRKRSTALVNGLFRLDLVMEKVLLHIQDIKQEGETQDNLHKAYYYDHLIKHWQLFIDETKESLDENKIPPKSELRNLLTQIETSIRQSRADINEMYATGARDTLYNELLPMQANIKETYDKTIEGLRKKGAPQERIDKEYQRYHGVTEQEHTRLNELNKMASVGPLSPAQQNEQRNLQKKADNGIDVTPEKIERILKGNMGDANFFNSYLEGYLYNTDPIIGGLASYVKNKMNDVMAEVQANYNDFASDMQKPLADAGYNPYKPGDMGERMGFLDTVAKREEDGTLTKRSVWTFLNPFKNYRYDYDEFKDRVEKAQFEFTRTGTEEAKQAMIDAIASRQAFMRNYFHQQYVPEFYEREILFEKDQIGKDALYKRKEWGERLRALTEPANTPSEQLAISDEVDLMWREYRQMRSRYYANGKPKTGHDLEVAKRIREYHEASLKFYDTKPRKGVFQNALKGYEQELIDSGQAEDPEKFKALRQEWINKNTIKTPKQEWYEWRNKLFARQSEIYAKLPKSEQELLDESLIMQEIFDLTGGFKDSEGQTKATEMSPRSRAKVVELEKQLEVIRKSAASRNGLTRAQNDRFSELHTLRTNGQWSPQLADELASLYDLKNKYGLSKFELRELENIRTQLQGDSTREATDYYVDIMNTWLDQLSTTGLTVKQIDKASADWVLDNAVIGRLLGQNKDFDKWFKDNHLLKEKFNVETKQMEPMWVRSTLWSITVPTDPSQYETFDILDDAGNVVETIQGKPITKYYTRVVKPEYKTEKIVGKTVDNTEKWLPKTVEQGAKDATYINERYFNTKASDPKLFYALEKMKEHHLKNQEGLGYKSKLYLDYPRYRKSTLETLQTKNLLTIYAQRIKDFFKGAKDDAEDGLNDTAQMNLVRMDMFDNGVTEVPIHGLYDVDSNDVSTDITLTMMQYMLSGARQKQLVKISPIARAVQSVVGANKLNKTDSKGFEFINKFNFYNRGIKTYEKQSGDSVRKKAIDNFLEREFEGKRMTGAGSDVPWLNNTASLLFKRASFGFFALNIPSALKNSYGAKFQGLIEASAGKYMTHTSFQKGNAWSYATMAELSFGKQLYNKGPKSLRQQIVEVFDPAQDRFEDKFGEGMSRTIAKDVANMSWLYNFRRWVELQATLQIFGGMMYHQSIEQTVDGVVKEIPYVDAWETRDGKIQLKEGIDPKWGITYDAEGKIQVGDDFKRFKNKVHQVMNNLQGAYAKFDQPEAQRYLAFRFLSYLRRYFTTMTLNRFGFSGRFFDPQPRLNPGAGDVQMGFYVTFIKMMKDTVTSLGKNLMYMTDEEKRASLKVLTEVGSLVAINLIMGLALGWDPDDDDKYEKLRQRSGALPFPMVPEDPDRPFNGWGYLENHMLYLAMNVRAENEQFIPLPGYGLDDYSAMLDMKSIAFGPTVQTYKDIFEDALDIIQGDESAYYKRQVGPYEYQQEGGAKIWAHIGRTIGLSGSSIDPAKGIKGFQSVQARAR